MHKSHQPFWHTFQNMLFWSLFDEFHEFESHRQMFFYRKLACKFSLLTLVVKKSCKYILRTVALQFKITVSIKKNWNWWSAHTDLCPRFVSIHWFDAIKPLLTSKLEFRKCWNECSWDFLPFNLGKKEWNRTREIEHHDPYQTFLYLFWKNKLKRYLVKL